MTAMLLTPFTLRQVTFPNRVVVAPTQTLGVDTNWNKWPPCYGGWLELRDRIGVEA
jgi:2,4-dienoyl-CoA reductase-like NADH-dependent reductase (Old Yellow Enzyme family)